VADPIKTIVQETAAGRTRVIYVYASPTHEVMYRNNGSSYIKHPDEYLASDQFERRVGTDEFFAYMAGIGWFATEEKARAFYPTRMKDPVVAEVEGHYSGPLPYARSDDPPMIRAPKE
jgi:hypothetical protein